MTGDLAPTFVWQAIASGREGPGPRSRHGLAYHRGARATILFGGVVWSGGWSLRSDTWELRDGCWSSVALAGAPPARHRGAMVYDSRRGCCVLFGGQTKTLGLFATLGDTWTFEDCRWRRCAAGFARRPSPRCGHAMAFDEESGEVVLFGGAASRPAQSLGDTWTSNGGAWRPVPGDAPPARRYAALAYDPALKGCVLNGGSEDDDGVLGFGDSWLFRDRTWTRLPSGFDVQPHDDHGLAYHQAARRLVMFGGLAGPHGVRVAEAGGWRPVEAPPLPPRFQCSPLTWDEALGGLVFHGGEARHGGPQFDVTWVLRRRAAPEARPRREKGEYGLGWGYKEC